ncbi:phage integrase SAM-like domain-containing protein [Lewinella sp. LCG006]|uniref:phage integrase SAM-like domain-containing protein n=1 Tax=Lewinella sp. LCG006 TaxID=3231911 RepID=UPI0034604F87
MNYFSKIRYSLLFNRKGRLNLTGEALIQIKAYQDGRNRYFSTGITIRPEFWDKRNRKISPKHPNHFVYNQRINQQLHDMEAFEIQMINQHGTFPLDRLDEYVNASTSLQISSFLAFFDRHLEQHEMKPGAWKMYAQTLNKWREFRKEVYFLELNYKLVKDFDRYLRDQGLSLNTIKKHHDRTTTVVNYAIREDYLSTDNHPYKRFKAKGEEPDRPFLTEEELTAIEQLTFSQEEAFLKRVRDIFLFACYTGLRFGDVSKLRVADVTETAQGYVLNLTAQKTNKRLELPLNFLFRNCDQGNSKPEAIIGRYLKEITILGNSEQTAHLPLFKISNQYLNRSLKTVAERAGIRKKITAHVGRRTFATIMARKVKAPILQRLLQHSRPDMTNIYIHLSNKDIESELQAIEW